MKLKSSSIKTLKINYPIEWERELEKYPKLKKDVWNEEKISFLKKYMGIYSSETIGKILGISRCAVENKIKNLKQ